MISQLQTKEGTWNYRPAAEASRRSPSSLIARTARHRLFRPRDTLQVSLDDTRRKTRLPVGGSSGKTEGIELKTRRQTISIAQQFFHGIQRKFG